MTRSPELEALALVVGVNVLAATTARAATRKALHSQELPAPDPLLAAITTVAAVLIIKHAAGK